jgi:uncharacterized protein YdhG (YjbR/CyaY superfamily)
MTLIDDYLKKVEPVKKKELKRIRTLAREIVPGAEEAIVYGMPTLKYQGMPFLGFDAHKNHIGIYPFSGKVIPELKDQMQDYETTRGAIRVPLDNPMSKSMLRKVINCRLKGIRTETTAKRRP